MAYIVSSTEKVRGKGADYETKAMLYLMGGREDLRVSSRVELTQRSDLIRVSRERCGHILSGSLISAPAEELSTIFTQVQHLAGIQILISFIKKGVVPSELSCLK